MTHSSTEQLKALERALREFDWYYEYSDDREAWARGRAQKHTLYAIVAALPQELRAEARNLWDEIAPRDVRLPLGLS